MNEHETERRSSIPVSDFPPPKKKGAGRSRQLVGLVSLLILIPTFMFVMVRRSKTREIRYVENPENARDESLAAAHGSSRPRKARATRVKSAEIDKVAAATNRGMTAA